MVHRINPKTPPRNTKRARQLRRGSTIPERILWRLLRNRGLVGLKFRRQAPVGPFVVDYLCEEQKLVVELDGLTHVGRAEYDARRTAYLQEVGLRVVRVTNDQVLADIEYVAIDILRAIGLEDQILPKPAKVAIVTNSTPQTKTEAGKPSPQPSPRGRGS